MAKFSNHLLEQEQSLQPSDQVSPSLQFSGAIKRIDLFSVSQVNPVQIAYAPVGLHSQEWQSLSKDSFGVHEKGSSSSALLWAF